MLSHTPKIDLKSLMESFLFTTMSVALLAISSYYTVFLLSSNTVPPRNILQPLILILLYRNSDGMSS